MISIYFSGQDKLYDENTWIFYEKHDIRTYRYIMLYFIMRNSYLYFRYVLSSTVWQKRVWI